MCSDFGHLGAARGLLAWVHDHDRPQNTAPASGCHNSMYFLAPLTLRWSHHAELEIGCLWEPPHNTKRHNCYFFEVSCPRHSTGPTMLLILHKKLVDRDAGRIILNILHTLPMWHAEQRTFLHVFTLAPWYHSKNNVLLENDIHNTCRAD